MSTKSNTPSSTPTTSTTPRLSLMELAQAFKAALHDETDGLVRFNEIEDELRKTQAGTPEFAALRKERTQMIVQVRTSRKVQEALKYQMLKA